jgi:hypothetical protein
METRKLYVLRERKKMMIERTRDGKEILEKKEKFVLPNQYDEYC